MLFAACYPFETEDSTSKNSGNDTAAHSAPRISVSPSAKSPAIAKAIATTNTNIRTAGIKANDRNARGAFVVEVRDLAHLRQVMRAVEQVEGVEAVEREQVFGPQAALFGAGRKGAMQPFGQHKGYGLMVMCELLGGALGGLYTMQPAQPRIERLLRPD